MKTRQSAFAGKYLAALDRHLRMDSAWKPKAARAMGLQAVTLGLETLDLARIHEEAMITLVLPDDSARANSKLIRRAGVFFAEALTPIEETHRSAQEVNAELMVTIETLNERTRELADANKELEQEIVQRKVVEESLRTSELTSSQLLEKSRDMQEELRHLSRRLLSAQEEERKRISRELHDVIAQTLAGINLRLATLKTQNTANTKELHEKIAITQRLVEKSVEIVHRFARDLRPSVLDDLGLVPALKSFIKSFTAQTGLRVSFRAFAAVEELDGVARTVLYRVAQEALTNVGRHAEASEVKIAIRARRGAVCMEIHDDGKGFQVVGAVSRKKPDRLGLLGMKERVEMVGGTFLVESAPERETIIRVVIPFESRSVNKARVKKRPAGSRKSR